MASPKIELKNVSHQFAGEVLLDQINLRILEGEKFVLMGPSGQGKSTLLKILSGILRPTSGEVWVSGVNLYDGAPKDILLTMREMGMLFQKNALFDSLSVSENVAFPLREVTDLDSLEIKARVESFLKAVQIDHASDLYPDEISGGMQKRLGIARALALEPKIVLYDDPTAGLDPITSRVIIDLINQLQADHHSTLVAVTNDMARAFQLADRLGLVFKGELIESGGVKETQASSDPRVSQFIRGALKGPITETP